MSEAYMGEIKLFGGNYAPRDWAFCNGQVIAISESQALFSILGTYYGGDGRVTFALPDLRGRVPLHVGGTSGNGSGLSTHLLGQQGGIEQVPLAIEEMPEHTHAITSSTNTDTTTADLKVSSSVGDSDNPSSATSMAAKTGSALSFAKTLSTDGSPSVISDAVVNISGGDLPTSTESTGGGQPHYNLQPYLGLNYIICMNGLYPSRN